MDNESNTEQSLDIMSDNNYECDGDNFDNVYLAWQYTIFSTKNKPECIIEHSKKNSVEVKCACQKQKQSL